MFVNQLNCIWSVVISLYNMEWNVKWEWENNMMFGSKACESPKEQQFTDRGVDEAGEFDGGSFNFSGFDSIGVDGSDLGRSSSTKSSISACTDSSPNKGLKQSNFTFEACDDDSHGNLGKYVEQKRVELSRHSPSMEASIGYDGPSPALKLAKKTKSSSQNALIPSCQVEGCNLDLSSAKEYHRKHRVCHCHSKCPKVIIGGVERRFCQQCSRFHSLSDFDEKKRSCRRRLFDHNARRRKPQQETIKFNSARLSSWFYDSRKSMNLVFNNGPLAHHINTAYSTSETSEISNFTITRGLTLNPSKADSINGQSLLGGVKLSGTTGMQSNAYNLYSASNSAGAEVFSQGVEETMFSLNTGAAPESPRALSLLSNKPSSEPECISTGHSMHVNQISMAEQAMHAIPQSSPFESTEHRQAQHLFNSHINTFIANGYSGGSFQGIQLSKDPFDDFYVNGLN